MRIAHISDLHLDEGRRPDDTERVLEAFLAAAKEAGIDLTLITGDLTADGVRDSVESERERLRRFIGAALEIAPVEIIQGNHDKSPDSLLFSEMRRGGNGVRYHTRVNFPAASVADLMVHTRAGMAGILAVPWFSRAGVAAKLPASVPSAGITHAINELAAQILVAARAEADRVRAAGGVPILMHHGEVIGAAYSSGFRPFGEAVAYTVEQLREVGAAYVALGHYHRAQEWEDGRIAYAGSIEARNAGEPEQKGWRLIEIDGERFSNTFVPLPARRIVLLEIGLTDYRMYTNLAHLGEALSGADVKGALVRFQYHIRPEDKHLVDEDAIRRALLDAGAHEVKVEAVPEVRSRVRCEEIAEASGLYEELMAWAGSKGIEIGEAQRERLRLLCAELEAPKGQEVAA